jgi:hypothetical protein
MNDPWVVVVGTLDGVILTSVSGLSGIILTARHQRAVAERQAQQEAKIRLRSERREIFVNYLAAYRDVYDKALTIAGSRFHCGSNEKSSETLLAEDFLEQSPQESARFSRAYQELVITGGPSTRNAARDCTSKLWDLAHASTDADADSFAWLKDQTRPSRQRLRGAMRAEPGVE